MAKTREQVESLKELWLNDPNWDIEDTEGFEAYRAELMEFQKEQARKWQAEKNQREEARTTLVREQTGVLNEDILLALHTWKEIELQVENQDRYIWRFENYKEQVDAELLQAQVRATLLQAAQLKRIADALENIQSSESFSETVRILGTGE